MDSRHGPVVEYHARGHRTGRVATGSLPKRAEHGFAHSSAAEWASLWVDQIVDASPIRSELGWQTYTRFADGMERTRQWYRQQQDVLRNLG